MFRKEFLPDAKYVVGQDHYGNVYFEVPAARRMKRISSHGLTHDSPPEKIDAFMKGQYQNKTPTEWQHWLRHARADPPKEHEILMNEHVRMRTLQRAHDKDLKHQQWKEEKEQEKVLEEKYGKQENYKSEQYVDPTAETEEWKP
ncbi:Oidioi.mRNA.OKI2018_I69.PAR.g10270.t1.cds [Oikopleura dioica]|uniref:Oidioi.mRNA.OKI2018_I69.PAR.g10270.t1.cds n=1 Tax=Oikopleura dioica TaxID=34765 RepID=A0ABN7RV52_OIKDI|nr:Oidioi.mRNA.OKI2018_I69.PAR.g10270.t1.cds [Oikopleura dioica]